MSFEKKDVEAGTSVEPVLLPMDAAIQHKNTSFARGLKGRHIQLLSIGGYVLLWLIGDIKLIIVLHSVIGTGLFIGSGRAITNAGPLSCVLSYSIFCILIFFVSQGAGEMATFLPVQGSFVNWAGRWIEPAAGFATGWNVSALHDCLAVTAADYYFQYYYTTLAFAAADGTFLCLANSKLLNFYASSQFPPACKFSWHINNSREGSSLPSPQWSSPLLATGHQCCHLGHAYSTHFWLA